MDAIVMLLSHFTDERTRGPALLVVLVAVVVAGLAYVGKQWAKKSSSGAVVMRRVDRAVDATGQGLLGLAIVVAGAGVILLVLCLYWLWQYF